MADEDNIRPDSGRRKRGPYKSWLQPGSAAKIPYTTARRYRKREEQGEPALLPESSQLPEPQAPEPVVPEQEPQEFAEVPQLLEQDEIEFDGDLGQDSEETRVEDVNLQNEDRRSENYFSDDNDDDVLSDEIEEDDLGATARSFEKLNESLKGHLKEPIVANVVLTPGEILLGALQLKETHKLSNQCLIDTVNLINAIFHKPILPTSQFLLDQLLFNTSSLHHYFYCQKCQEGFGNVNDYKDKQVYLCPNCQSVNNLSNLCSGRSYLMLDLDHQLELILSEHWDELFDPLGPQSSEDVLSDIYNGKVYRNFQDSLKSAFTPEENTRVITVTMFTDGCPIFVSSNSAITPVTLMINELPPSVRMQKILLAGLWFGEKSPIMDLFMETFAETFRNGLEKGIRLSVKGQKVLVIGFMLGCCCDSKIRPPVQGSTQFNGMYGCNWCYHKGVYFNYARIYPYDENTVPEKRTHEQFIELASELHELQENALRENKKPPVAIKGVKFLSPLSTLKYFDLVLGMIVDYMHAALLGVTKYFVKKWLEETGPWYVGDPKNRKKLNKRLTALSPPLEVRRRVRFLTDYSHYKAREWENVALFYSSIFEDILPGEYYKHWMIFVEAFHILLRSEITVRDIETAEVLIKQFVMEAETLYGRSVATFNLHLLSHFADHCRRWGPLWAMSSFGFESDIGKLKTLVKANRGIQLQICRRLSYSNGTQVIRQCLPVSDCMTMFLNKVQNPKLRSESIRIGVVRLFGSEGVFKPLDNESWLFEQANVPTDSCVTYNKAIIRNVATVTCEKSTLLKFNNSVVKLLDGKFVLVKKIVLSKEREALFFIGRTMNSVPLLQVGSRKVPSSIRKVLHTSDEKSLFKIEDVKCSACSFVTEQVGHIVIPLPYIANTN